MSHDRSHDCIELQSYISKWQRPLRPCPQPTGSATNTTEPLGLVKFRIKGVQISEDQLYNFTPMVNFKHRVRTCASIKIKVKDVRTYIRTPQGILIYYTYPSICNSHHLRVNSLCSLNCPSTVQSPICQGEENDIHPYTLLLNTKIYYYRGRPREISTECSNRRVCQ